MSKISDKNANKQEKPQFILQLEKNWTLRILTMHETGEVEPFIDLFKDFFILCEGESGSLSGILNACPPSKDIKKDKFVIGLYDKKTLIGVLDIIRDYPQKRSWTIGYLLIHPKHQSKGLGSKFIQDLEASLRPGKMRCVVQKQNHRALDFWRNNGFKIISQTKSTVGSLQSVTYVLEK